jgi:type I restriction enzyme S subunit
MGTGSTFTAIKRSNLESLPFPLAPLNEQRRIVAKIEALFDESKTARIALDTVSVSLKRFRQSVLAKAFKGEFASDSVRVPATRRPEPKRPCEVANLFNGRAVGSGTSKVRVFKTRHVYPTGLKMDNPSYLKCEQESRINSDRFLRDGDVLIVNTWQNLGRVCYVEKPGDNWTVDSQIMIVRPSQGNIGKYLFYFLFSERGYELLLNCERGALTAGVSRKLTHIYPKHVGNVQIPYVTPDVQHLAVSYLDSALTSASIVEAAANAAKITIDELGRAILSKAFRGELVPKDPNDEPANAILERLKRTQDCQKTSN